MSEDKLPQRPDGLNQDANSHTTVPRVEVEPTPAGPGASAQQPAQTAQTPFSGPAPQQPQAAETITRTVVKSKTKKGPVFLSSLLGLVVGSVLVVALVMSGAFRITDNGVEGTSSGSGGSSTQNIKIDAEDTTLPKTVAAKTLPSVVSITAQGEDENSGGIGSGVILDTDGNILTNYHVIEGATQLSVSVDGDKSYEAEVVGSDESSDLAVIKLKDAKDAGLTPIEIGDSDDISVGEWVMAIGSPFGNEQSVSTGIVSALYRSTALPSTSGTTIYANMIQTDAAINPGNSGGALVDDEGKLIGINSVIESYSGSSSGVGFAIPVNYAKKIADQIIAGKTPVHPYLGVTLTSVNGISSRQQNQAVTEGAQVVSVTQDSPAAKAGLEANDIITKIDDTEVTSADSLIMAMRTYDVGDKVTLTLVRGNDEKKIEVTLGSDEGLQKQQEQENSSSGDSVEGNGAGNSMSEDDVRRYLEDLLGLNGGSSSEGGNGSQGGNGFSFGQGN